MKILKIPFETTMKCECGCEFEFDYDDLDIKTERIYWYDNFITKRILSVKCPFCSKDIELSKGVKDERN